MPEDLMTRGEVAKYLGISNKMVDSYLEPVRRSDGRPYRIGKQFAYLKVEAEESKSEIERERRRVKEITFGPEDLGTGKKKQLDKNAFIYELKRAMGRGVTESANGERDKIEKSFGRKEFYTGDAIIKSGSYGWEIGKEVDPAELLKHITTELLKRRGVIETSYNVKVLERIGPELIRNRIKEEVRKFETFVRSKKAHVTLSQLPSLDDGSFYSVLDAFSRQQKTNIPIIYLTAILNDYRNGRLTDTKLGKHSRALLKTCIIETPKKRNLKLTLDEKHKKTIEKLAKESVRGITSSSKFDELAKNLFSDE